MVAPITKKVKGCTYRLRTPDMYSSKTTCGLLNRERAVKRYLLSHPNMVSATSESIFFKVILCETILAPQWEQKAASLDMVL